MSSSPPSSTSSLSPNSFQFNRQHDEEFLSKSDTGLLLFFAKSPLSLHEDRSIMAEESTDFGDGFCSPVEEPPSPMSYLVRPQEIQEVEDRDFQPDSSSDDHFSSEEAESSSSSNNYRRRSSATTRSTAKKKQTLADLMNFDASSREESLGLLGKSRQRPLEKSKFQQHHGKDSLLIAVCGGKKSTTTSSMISIASNSSSRRRSNEPSPLKSSPIPRSKSSAGSAPRSSSRRYDVNLTKSKSLGAASYVVRVDQTGRGGGASSGVPKIKQQLSSNSGRKSSVSFAASDSMVTVMDRYQQRIKDENSRKHGSSFLPYKRALLSFFFPLPSLWSHHRQHQQQQYHHHHHRQQQQQQHHQQHHHQHHHQHHQTVAYS